MLWCLIGLVLAGLVPGCQEDQKKEPAHRLREHEHLRASLDPLACESGTNGAAEPTIAPVDVLFINGDSITVSDILSPVRVDLENRMAYMAPKAYWDYASRVIQTRIRDEARACLLFQQASRDISESEWEQIDVFVDQRIRDIINGEYHGRQARYERALREAGLTMEKAREHIRKDMAIQRYLYQNIQNKIAEPTRQELWTYFQGHKDEMVTPPQREFLLIEIAKDKPLEIVVDDTGETRTISAREAADHALARLQKGDPFEEVARDCSTGIHAKDGGSWGMIQREGLRERYQVAVDALYALDSGETSRILEGPDALFIVRCGEIDPGQEPDFKKLQSEIVQNYSDHQYNLLVEELVSRLEAGAYIFPKDPTGFYLGVMESCPGPGKSES